jgi:hypothetical protein
MILIALSAALLQYGSCQASPDRYRAPAEAVDLYLEALEDRAPDKMLWVVRPGAQFTRAGDTRSDDEVYAAMRADTNPRSNLVIRRLKSGVDFVEVEARWSQGPDRGRDIHWRFEVEEGCIVRVNESG